MRVFWHTYVGSDETEVTGFTGVDVLRLSGGVGSLADVMRIEDCMRRGGPFNDPRLGCLRYDRSNEPT